MRATYINYRHFRALPTGVSASGEIPVDQDSEFQTVVLFGDSRVATWKPGPQARNYRFLNAGVAGESTSEMRRRFVNDVLRHSPDIVILQAGINDLTAAATRGITNPQQIIARMHDNMRFFLTELAARDIEVIVTSIIPHYPLNVVRRVFWSPQLTGSVTDTNRQFETLARETNAEWLSLDPLFLDAEQQPHADLYRDALHLKPAAYEKLNDHLVEKLAAP